MKTFGIISLYFLLIVIAGCLVAIVLKVGEIYEKQVGRYEQEQITSTIIREEFTRQENIGNVFINEL